jgi:heat shock protein HslJ
VSKARPSTLALVGLAILGGCQPAEVRQARGGGSPPGLAGSSWRLVEIQARDSANSVARPDDPARYTLAFGADGWLSARLDCNSGSASWQSVGSQADGGSVEIGPVLSTRVMCPQPSLGDELGRRLEQVRSYRLQHGRLSLVSDASILVWEPAPPD